MLIVNKSTLTPKHPDELVVIEVVNGDGFARILHERSREEQTVGLRIDMVADVDDPLAAA